MEQAGAGVWLRARGIALLVLAVVSLRVLPAGAAAITRSDFPEGFVFGAGTSAYQVRRLGRPSSSSVVMINSRFY